MGVTFEAWLAQIGKSARTAKSYSGAVSGRISEWAITSGVISDNLLEFTDPSEFASVVGKVESLPIFIERDSNGNGMYSAALKQYAAYLSDLSGQEIQDDIAAILDDKKIPNTEKAQYINARVGQGKYRKGVIDYWGCCSVTGYSSLKILIASHIKPWKHSSSAERIDPFNGLLLLPNLDKVFDLGYVTFGVGGEIHISKSLDEPEVVGIRKDMRLQLGKQHMTYMEYHRDVVFENFLREK